MNTSFIRERLNRDANPFVLRLMDGTRVQVSHPDFAAVSPGQIAVINPKTEGLTRINPLHVIAIEELANQNRTENRPAAP